MPCACNGTASVSGSTGQWKVTLPNGEVRILASEHEANVARTMAGGGKVEKA